MTTQTSAITLSNSSYVTNATGNTVITTGPAVINPTYTAGVVQSFTNFGTLDSTGAAKSNQGAGIFITVGTAAGGAIGNLGGLITGYEYGIDIVTHNGTGGQVHVFNSGTITDRVAGSVVTANALLAAGVFAGNGAVISLTNAGLIQGGEGIWLQTDDAGVQTVINDAGARIIGNATEGGNIYGIKIQDNPNGALIGTGNIYNAGYIKGIIDDAAKYTNITITSTGTVIGEIFDLGTGTLSLIAGETVTGGAHFVDGANNGLNLGKATIVLNGTTTTTGTLLTPGNYTGFGSVTLGTGATWQLGSLGNTAGLGGVTQISDFGTLDLGGNLSGNTINMEGSVAGAATEVDFLGSQTSTPITDYGAGDQIVFATLAPGPGDTFQDSYNTATGVLTVTELNASGTVIGSATATVSGIPGGPSLNTGSFVDINGPNGETVVLGTSTLATQGSIYLDYGAMATLDNTGTVDTVPVTFGNHAGSLGALNTLDLNGSVSGTSSPYTGTITGFGLNDDIIIGPSIIPGDNSWSSSFNDYVTLGYSGSLLTVGEVVPGVGTTTTTLDVGTGYSAGSFVALYGTSGINIETPATVDANPLTLVGTGGSTVEFVDPLAYTGDLSPGPSIVAGEVVSVVTSSLVELQNPETNNGTIILSGSAMLDNPQPNGAGYLSGTGTVALVNGGTLGIAGGTAANTIAFGGDTSSLLNVLQLNNSASSFASPITGFGANDEILLKPSVLPTPNAGSSLSDTYNPVTGQLVVTETGASGAVVGTETLDIANTGSLTAGSFVAVASSAGVAILLGSTPLTTNTGSIFIDYGQSVALTDTAAVDSIPVTFGSHGTSLSLNTLDLDGTVAGTSSPYTGTISGFGLNDDIILGPSVLPSVAAGDAVSLSYAGSLLTATELNSSGATIGSTTIDVGTGYAPNGFVALLGTSGVNIETPATVGEQPLTFSGTGSSFEDPTQYAGGLAPGSSIVPGETVSVISGSPTIAAGSPLTNSGTIILSGTGTSLTDNGSLAGFGTVFVGAGTGLTLGGPGTTTNTIIFAGGPGTIDIGGGSFAGTIGGIGGGDSIVIGGSILPTGGTASVSLNTATGVITVTDTIGGTTFTDTIATTGTIPGTLSVSSGPNGIIITDVPCFAAGTRILTATGQVKVEDLTVGDTVLTLRDGTEKKIIWTGSRTISLGRHANPQKVRPVRILAGAFGPGAPERDLVLSPDHALFIEGQLIEAKTLVNGATIIWDMDAKFVTYHHIELESHDVVLAEGLAAETFLDSGNRQNFNSDAGPTLLHPDFAAASREKACAPLALDGEIVRRTRQNLLDRAAALGFARTGDISLTVIAGAHREHRATTAAYATLRFTLPAGATAAELHSATGVPAEMLADPSDRRVLGVSVAALVLVANGQRTQISLDDAAHHGFYPMATDHRWTNGQARIALPAYTGEAVLEVTLNGQATRWAQAGKKKVSSAF